MAKARYGKLAMLQVNAKLMFERGHHFYVSENGVWLTEHIPPEFLKMM